MSTRFKGLSGLVRFGRPDRSWRGQCDSICRVQRFVVSRALGGWNRPWLGEFIREVWRFRTLRRREIAIHYAPEIWHDVATEVLLVHWADELKGLERKFAFRLPRVQAFLFPAAGCVRDLFGPQYAAVALPEYGTVVVADDGNRDEHLRHELVHLFADRWNRHAPPLLSEGLAVHLQQRWGGQPIATVVRRFASRSEWVLGDFVDREFFFDPANRLACYMIAGSFSGFLIDEFGWEAYRQLYRRCRPHLVEWAFQRSLGVSFKGAEELWRKRI